MHEFIQITTTFESQNDANEVAEHLIKTNLAACVQITGPIASVYRWQEKVERVQEWLCLIKTSSARYRQVETAIKALHPYETPEIIAVPVVSGSQEYLAWMHEALQAPSDPKEVTNI